MQFGRALKPRPERNEPEGFVFRMQKIGHAQVNMARSVGALLPLKGRPDTRPLSRTSMIRNSRFHADVPLGFSGAIVQIGQVVLSFRLWSSLLKA